jgi:CBS domain containing-hemolysin-like protein
VLRREGVGMGVVERNGAGVGIVTQKDLVEPLTGDLRDW